jgi:hypothetical protein
VQQEVVLTILAKEEFHLKLIAAAVADPTTGQLGAFVGPED